MRARLLDMGGVGPLRTYSIPHAVTEAIEPSSEAALILISPTSPVVSIDQTSAIETAVRLEESTDRGIPVVRRSGGLGTTLVGPGHLLVAASFPRARAHELSAANDAVGVLSEFTRAIETAVRRLGTETVSSRPGIVSVAGRDLAHIHFLTLGDGCCCLGALAIDVDESLAEHLIRDWSSASWTDLRRELPKPPSPTAIAEAVVDEIEEHLGLDLVPSMPQPHEMEAIYQWDMRLLANETGEPHAASVAG